ncbi:hypothetical protein [Cellvibrio mixtus]|uniref:hypothetical protein n=1 Tax=Cellvibrio mixtus TaxID=39650 RepID=UPI000587B075|nr:hypothetical protein [Cellvibrio mixtus]
MIRHGFLHSRQYIFIVCCLAVLAPWSRADGLTDLRKTLKQMHASNPIGMDVQFKLFGHTGEDDELIEREGLINVRLEDGAHGMHIAYPADVLALLHQEELAKIADENVRNSALNAVGEFDYWEWRELMYPAAQLELALERYTFLGEQEDTYDGKPARSLTFSLPMEKIDKKYRKYVKKYHHRFTLWIDDKGTPLASASTETGSGRVFLVIGFQFQNTVNMTYQQERARLIGIRREVKEETWGAAMQAQRHFTSTVSRVEFPTPEKISQ